MFEFRLTYEYVQTITLKTNNLLYCKTRSDVMYRTFAITDDFHIDVTNYF